MEFLRPEAVKTLKRWQETIVFAILLLATLRVLWLAYVWSSWTMGLLGLALTAAVGSLLYIALLRMQLRGDGMGVGLVEIDERNITYLAPHLGGVVSIDSLRKIDVSPTRNGGCNWVLYSFDGPPVMIPFTAKGADALIEAFSALRGMGVDRISRAAKSNSLVIQTIWEKGK
ncbi:MAG: hypothetical protein JKY31_09545 [Rhodobacteraceae bacterium]|nr:hypothetical protein [Paracoccaceae bacterium]